MLLGIDAESLRSGARRYGWAAYAISRVFARLQSVGLHLWLVHIRPLEPEFVIPPEHAARFEFRRLAHAEALEQSRLNPKLAMTDAFLSSAFARGDICVGAFDGGRLVAYTWRSLDRAPVDGELWLKLVRSDCRYGYKALVLTEYRGQRINKTVRSFYDREMAAMGIKYNVAYIDLHNLASMRAHQGLHRERIGIAGYFRRHRVWATFRTPAVRRYLQFVRTEESET